MSPTKATVPLRWSRKSSPFPLAGVNYLDLVPAHRVESESTDEQVVLLMPRYRDWLWGRLVQPRLRGEKRFIRVPLDARGTWLWERIDGERNVGVLARGFREAFPEEEGNVEERVCQYVAALEGHGFLTVEKR